MTVSTSKNLTVLGILTILGALVNGALEYLQTKTVNLAVLLTAVSGGIAMIMAKGAASTGGTVDGAGNPVAPPAP
jgi:hypothetical protein